MDATDVSPKEPNANSFASIFDEMCRRRGLDPEKERAAMKARENRRSYEPCPHYDLGSAKSKSPGNQAAPPPGHSNQIVTVQGADDLPMFRTKDELRAFLVELLMDDIVEICLGTMQRKP